jgi:hypothetical protein
VDGAGDSGGLCRVGRVPEAHQSTDGLCRVGRVPEAHQSTGGPRRLDPPYTSTLPASYTNTGKQAGIAERPGGGVKPLDAKIPSR